MKFPANTHRAGILGEASFLAANAGPTETSPTARGIFIREQLLCQNVPPPPPNVDTNLPEASEDKPLTRRRGCPNHEANPLCASCHRLMDPIGFGLESFDAIGRYREHETILIESETGKRSADKKIDLPLDTNGEVRGIPDSAFSDSVKLGQILSAKPGVPAVHGAPAFPLCVRPHGDIRGRGHHQSACSRPSAIPDSTSKTC